MPLARPEFPAHEPSGITVYTLADFFSSLYNNAHLREGGTLVIYMLLGGGLALFIRALYRRFGLTISNRDGFSATFPLLTIATVLIIFVVKSSLALSLGLVGALSIVRFRAAIKEPEELVFLFFCIAVGLALGAEYAELAVGGLLVFTIFVLIRHRVSRGGGISDSLLVTIAGPTSAVFDGDTEKLTAAVREVVGSFTVQRLDVDAGHVQFRAVVAPLTHDQVGKMIASLHAKLPGCSVSYVNLTHLM